MGEGLVEREKYPERGCPEVLLPGDSPAFKRRSAAFSSS